jgi:hypothetical protein
MEKLWHVIVPNLIGFCLMVGGWFLSILNVGIRTRFKTNEPMEFVTTISFIGLLMILTGAYLPRIWNKLRNK